MPRLGNQESRLDFRAPMQLWMKAMGYNRNQTSIKTGMTKDAISNILDGECKPSMGVIEKLYAVSGIDIYELALLNDDASRLPKPLQRLRKEMREEWAVQIEKMVSDKGLIPSGQW